jgi:hypothetical protein
MAVEEINHLIEEYLALTYGESEKTIAKFFNPIFFILPKDNNAQVSKFQYQKDGVNY